MKESNQALAAVPPVHRGRTPKQWMTLPPKFVLACLALIACFSASLFNWARFTLQSDLFSYALLIPFISLYLFWVNRKKPAAIRAIHRPSIAAILIGSGVLTLGVLGIAYLAGSGLAPQDSVALTTLSFVLLLAGICVLWLSASDLSHAVFPLAFLIFMVPFPIAIEQGVESFLQRGSAPPAYWLFQIVGTPVFRQDLVFQLPGMSLHIAPECSGIRSTMVLFITSILAGNLFLRSPWKRTVLTLVVIPLALVRNGFRVFTIGQLCVHFGPHMIDSPIHHRGGPIFFALSLIPFFLFLLYLVRAERSASKRQSYAATR